MKRPFSYVALRDDRVTHVISRIRPSRFSACNIEKLGIGPGDEAKVGRSQKIIDLVNIPELISASVKVFS